ncbi:ABC transporter substrate-binding protein [Vibrio cholerae]|uniref:ABC transporter substrate-binding protein n=1 Tax=Vibrio paracholerae TaxID=650003 RepID=UPI000DE335F6|nr:ABC transporter substrate-binding protein [Vibrio paracholerae]ELJ8548261.1 ABC transporter substrate-binding protein [Vibrio cholerae]ELY5187914.1 ABC transporter substrate-binding protein [Vibrio cholerae]ELY5288607.1 ABC transporter substrate-binding protein [Vibrio cholerae]RBM73735.1 ABC transporter substrate-binding protein [Vibrio paracholerae]
MKQHNLIPIFGKIALSVAAALSFSTWAATYNEAPQLAELVKAGKLPAVEQRLPENPLVVEPNESIGQYGGTLNLVGTVADNGHRIRTVAYDNLFNFDTTYSKVIPNLATDFTSNAENTEYVITLRKGVKWSDGSPFTAEDIAFYINEIVGDPEHSGNRPLALPTHDAARAEIVDKYTVKITLSKPNGLFIRSLATVDSESYTAFPKQYCSQFLPKFNDKAVANAKAAGFDSWRQYAATKCEAHYFIEHYTNVDRPVLTAWKVTAPPGPNASYALFERNPYYWQVDTEGNQLPYLDAVRWRYSEDQEEMVLRAANGEADYQHRNIGQTSYRPLLIENEKKGGYTYKFRPSTLSTELAIALNQTTKDPLKRELFQNKDFRIALSHAIDREEISETVFSGSVGPYQVAPLKISPFYDEQMATQYTEFDPDKANQILDSIGLNKRDKEGYRLLKNGQRLRIDAISKVADKGVLADSLELVKNQWKAVGVFLDIRVLEINHVTNLRLTNDFDMIPIIGDGGVGIIDDARHYMPFSPESTWGLGYYLWVSEPTNEFAVEPPAHVKRQLELWKKLTQTSSQDEQNGYMKEIIQIAKDNFYVIGTVESMPAGVVVNNKLHNVPENMPQSYNFPTPGPMRLGQLWKSK